MFSRVAIVWGAQDPLYKYPFTPFPKPKGCELTLETGPECTEERNHQVMLARADPGRWVTTTARARTARRANPRAEGLLSAAAGHRGNAGDVEHC